MGRGGRNLFRSCSNTGAERSNRGDKGVANKAVSYEEIKKEENKKNQKSLVLAKQTADNFAGEVDGDT